MRRFKLSELIIDSRPIWGDSIGSLDPPPLDRLNRIKRRVVCFRLHSDEDGGAVQMNQWNPYGSPPTFGVIGKVAVEKGGFNCF
jgi:hypothetical protein